MRLLGHIRIRQGDVYLNEASGVFGPQTSLSFLMPPIFLSAYAEDHGLMAVDECEEDNPPKPCA